MSLYCLLVFVTTVSILDPMDLALAAAEAAASAEAEEMSESEGEICWS